MSDQEEHQKPTNLTEVRCFLYEIMRVLTTPELNAPRAWIQLQRPLLQHRNLKTQYLPLTLQQSKLHKLLERQEQQFEG